MDADKIHHCQVQKLRTMYLVSCTQQGHLLHVCRERAARGRWHQRGPGPARALAELLALTRAPLGLKLTLRSDVNSLDCAISLQQHRPPGCGPRTADGCAESRPGFRLTLRSVCNPSAVGLISFNKFSAVSVGNEKRSLTEDDIVGRSHAER